MRSASLRNALLRLAPYAAPGTRPRRPGRPRRVLIVRPDHLGDVLLSTPAVALLRAGLPEAELTYLVGPWSAAVAGAGPPVDRVDTLEFPGFTRWPKANVLEPYVLLLQEARRLRGKNYDLAVVLRGDHWWGALLCLAAGIPVRVGGRSVDTEALLTHTHRALPGEHAVEQTLGIARLALEAVGAEIPSVPGSPSFEVSVEARAQTEEWWLVQGLAGQRVVAIQPSAGAALKSWPVARWAALVDGLATEATVLLTGAPEDAALLDSIASKVPRPTLRVCGQSLEVTAALFERCALVIGLDSGAAHLAGAVGTPTVRLYGPAPVAKYGPWPTTAPDQRVLITDQLACVPCGCLADPPCGARSEPACLLALSVEQVLGAAKAVLDTTEN